MSATEQDRIVREPIMPDQATIDEALKFVCPDTQCGGRLLKGEKSGRRPRN